MSLSIHATEDREKVLSTLNHFITPEILDESQVIQDTLEGGYGNPIHFIEITVHKKKHVKIIFKNIISKLSDTDKSKLLGEFKERFNEEDTKFFIRINKEQAFLDNIQVSKSQNTIRIEIKLQSYNKDANFKQFLCDEGLLNN